MVSNLWTNGVKLLHKKRPEVNFSTFGLNLSKTI